MITDSIYDLLSLSFDEETIDKAVAKYDRAVSSGKFKSSNDKAIEAYLRKICEGELRPPESKKSSYALYRAENIYTELCKENPNFLADTFRIIHSLPVDMIAEIKRYAKSHYWYSKRMSDFVSPLTQAEHLILENMFYAGKTKDGYLTAEEHAISDRITKAYKDFEDTVMMESMCVVYEMRKKYYIKSADGK